MVDALQERPEAAERRHVPMHLPPRGAWCAGASGERRCVDRLRVFAFCGHTQTHASLCGGLHIGLKGLPMALRLRADELLAALTGIVPACGRVGANLVLWVVDALAFLATLMNARQHTSGDSADPPQCSTAEAAGGGASYAWRRIDAAFEPRGVGWRCV